MTSSDDTPNPLAVLTRETFLPWVGRTFAVHPPEGPAFDAELLAARDESLPDGRHGPRAPRAPFSLLFRPLDGEAHPQWTYQLVAEGFEPVSVFCVPVIDDDGTPRLQATFN